MFNIQEISSCYFTMILYCQQVNFTWEKCIQCAYRVFLHCTKYALNQGFFIEGNRSDPAIYSTLPAATMLPDSQFSIYLSFKLLFHYDIVLSASEFYM